MNLRHQTRSPGISTYALYKEEPSRQDPEFFHIEDIKSRARLFDWTINVHSHPQMYQVIFVRQGQVRVHLNGQEQELNGPCLFTLPPGVVHGFAFERDVTKGYVITLSRLLLLDERFQRNFPFHNELMQSVQTIHLDKHPEDLTFINQVTDELAQEYQDNAAGKQQLFEWLLYSLLIKMGRLVSASGQAPAEDRYSIRYRKLCELIEQHYREHQPCQFYADALCTTPIGLNRACQAVAGKSVGELLQDRLALEAQRMLIYSTAPVAVIAYDLGFSDPAYFSRFFKRRVGSSPSTFREHRDLG